MTIQFFIVLVSFIIIDNALFLFAYWSWEPQHSEAKNVTKT